MSTKYLLIFFGLFVQALHADTATILLAYVPSKEHSACADTALRVRVQYPPDTSATELTAPESIISCGGQETIQWDTSFYGTTTLEFDDLLPVIEVKGVHASEDVPWVSFDLNALKNSSVSLLPVIIDCPPELPYTNFGFQLLGIPEADYYQQYTLVRHGTQNSDLPKLIPCTFD